jgi:hypothetical protein
VARPVLLLPGGLRLTVDDTAPLDVAAKWWDALAVTSTYAALWYSTQRSGFPGGRHRQGGDQ